MKYLLEEANQLSKRLHEDWTGDKRIIEDLLDDLPRIQSRLAMIGGPGGKSQSDTFSAFIQFRQALQNLLDDVMDEINEVQQFKEFDMPSLSDDGRYVKYVGPALDDNGDRWAETFVDVNGPYTHHIDPRSIMVGLIPGEVYVYQDKRIVGA